MNNSTEDCAETDSDYLNTYNWWMECVVEIVIGLMGLIGNCIALPILHSKLMSSIFNKMLVFLTIFDNMFIICCVLEAIRKYIFTSNAQQLIFIYLLYQLQNIALTCSIYATVVLAVERYIAVSRPVEYHIMVNTSGSSPWRRVLAYMVPIILFGILFNLPKYFELKAILPERNNSDGSNGTNLVQFLPTELRLNEDYAFYYVHLTRFFITGILPFTSLLFLNYGIYRAMKQRRTNTSLANSNRNNNTTATNNHESEENRQALVLFFIVLLFLVCNVPRIVLNFYEMLTINAFRENVDNICFQLPEWVMITTSLSLLLMTINSSINFLIYCFLNPTFRTEFVRRAKLPFQCIMTVFDRASNLSLRQGESESVTVNQELEEINKPRQVADV